MNRDAADRILSGVQRQLWVLTSASGERRGGLIATFVCRASIVKAMPRVLVSLSIRHHSTNLVRESGAFALHLLTDQDCDLVWRFGLVSGREIDKLAGLEVRGSVTGSPVLSRSAAWLDCRVETSMDTGDREVFLAEVVEASAGSDVVPLTVDEVLAKAPADKVARMDELFAQDAAVDSRLIEAFRCR